MFSLKNVLLACVLALALGGCKDDDGPPATGDSSIYDGNPYSEGWTTTEGGPVVVYDGSVIITEDGGGTWVCNPTTCAGKLLECGNCLDDDGDGLVDSHDPECLVPCDNTEGPALQAGVGGVGGDQCGVDCYFDYGNGPGNDDCWWSHACDPLEPEKDLCPYDDKLVGTKKCPATQSPQCAEQCLPFTPNGCDCFGCCTFPELAGKGPGGADGYVWIGALDDKNEGTCTFDSISDPAKCPPCTPIPGCENDCGPCEVCIGRPIPPPECFQQPDAGQLPDGALPPDSGIPPTQQCPDGDQPCGLPGQDPCPPNYYCISGCCKLTIID